MTIRCKLLTIFLVFGVAPMLVVSTVNYVSGGRAVEKMLREEVEHGASRLAEDVKETAREREADVVELARLRSLRDYVQWAGGAPPAQVSGGAPPSSLAAAPQADLIADFNSFYRAHRDYFAAVTCVDREGRPLFRVEAVGVDPGGDGGVRFQTEDFVLSGLQVDARVWGATAMTLLRAPVTRESFGAGSRVTVPVFLDPSDPA
ncbi:MAG: hypothetical protein ACRD68_01680, partial [Pyrinomonadaceae bacterium]